MRFLVILSLAGVCLLAACPLCHGASGQCWGAVGRVPSPTPRDTPVRPFWPVGLFLGYISIDLKRHWRRSRQVAADHPETMSEVVSLSRPAPASRKPSDVRPEQQPVPPSD